MIAFLHFLLLSSEIFLIVRIQRISYTNFWQSIFVLFKAFYIKLSHKLYDTKNRKIFSNFQFCLSLQWDCLLGPHHQVVDTVHCHCTALLENIGQKNRNRNNKSHIVRYLIISDFIWFDVISIIQHYCVLDWIKVKKWRYCRLFTI